MDHNESTLRLWTSSDNILNTREKFEQFIRECKHAIRKETQEVSIDVLNIRAVILRGCEVSMILRRNEFRKAILRGLPANFLWLEAVEIISGQAKISPTSIIESDCLAVSDDGKTSWGYVVCADIQTCSELIHRLDKTSLSDLRFEGCTLSLHPSGEVRKDLPVITDSTIKVTWNSLPSTGKMFFSLKVMAMH